MILLALLISVSGAQTRNPADCMWLPANQALECSREIRAGRTYDVHYPADPFANQDSTVPTATTPARAPVEPTPVGLDERKTLAAEKQADAIQTMATLQIVELVAVSIGMIAMMIAIK
jgi:hypothetical protein